MYYNFGVSGSSKIDVEHICDDVLKESFIN